MALSLSLSGKCALVTGSTSGIGWGIAQAFAKAGCSILLHGLEKEEDVAHLMSKITSISPSKSKVIYSSANITCEKECEGLVALATNSLGKLDIVVNNAGVQFTSPTEKFPTDKWKGILDLNLSAPFYISRAVLPQMYERNWGRLIHIGSAHSLVASKNKSAYVASKHAILGLSKVIALESAHTGVTSNTICPGWVLTPLVQAQIERIAKEKNLSVEQAKKELLMEKQPSGEFVCPERLGELAVYLSSEGASQITGATLSMDGGWTAI